MRGASSERHSGSASRTRFFKRRSDEADACVTENGPDEGLLVGSLWRVKSDPILISAGRSFDSPPKTERAIGIFKRRHSRERRRSSNWERPWHIKWQHREDLPERVRPSECWLGYGPSLRLRNILHAEFTTPLPKCLRRL